MQVNLSLGKLKLAIGVSNSMHHRKPAWQGSDQSRDGVIGYHHHLIMLPVPQEMQAAYAPKDLLCWWTEPRFRKTKRASRWNSFGVKKNGILLLLRKFPNVVNAWCLLKYRSCRCPHSEDARNASSWPLRSLFPITATTKRIRSLSKFKQRSPEKMSDLRQQVNHQLPPSTKALSEYQKKLIRNESNIQATTIHYPKTHARSE